MKYNSKGLFSCLYISPSVYLILFLSIFLSYYIQFNLSDFTRRAYGTNYIEALRVQASPYFAGSIFL